jgi:hypothetical protein
MSFVASSQISTEKKTIFADESKKKSSGTETFSL